jgi:hypothetical protein
MLTSDMATRRKPNKGQKKKVKLALNIRPRFIKGFEAYLTLKVLLQGLVYLEECQLCLGASKLFSPHLLS